MKFFNVLSLFVLFAIATSFSQETKHRLTLNGGFSIPLSDFSATMEKSSAGFAKFGFCGALEYDFALGLANISWSTGFIYIANDFEADYFSKGINLILYESGAYTNYSLLTGLKYHKNLGESFTLFAVGQLGYNFANGPFLAGEFDGGDYDYLEIQMGKDSNIGFSIGCGFIANNTTTVGLRYINMGSPIFAQDTRYSVGGVKYDATIKWQQPVSVFIISVGYAIDLDS